jgi:hypothetical protein
MAWAFWKDKTGTVRSFMAGISLSPVQSACAAHRFRPPDLKVFDGQQQKTVPEKRKEASKNLTKQ